MGTTNRGRGDRGEQDASNMSNPVWEIPSKLMLVVNSIDKGNVEMQDLLRLLIEESKSLRVSHEELGNQHKDFVEKIAASAEDKQESCTEQIAQHIRSIEERPQRERDLRLEVGKAKSTIETLWQNTLNTQKQAFWNHYYAKKQQETYEELLQCNPSKMP